MKRCARARTRAAQRRVSIRAVAAAGSAQCSRERFKRDPGVRPRAGSAPRLTTLIMSLFAQAKRAFIVMNGVYREAKNNTHRLVGDVIMVHQLRWGWGSAWNHDPIFFILNYTDVLV